ncbi:MAG: DUF3291 domain-containing protein [Cyclobacteriaceae bacterium]
MIITITSIRLKNWWRFFELSYYGMRISFQIKKQAGFIRMKNTGFGYLHFTCSAWSHESDLKKFSREGAHLEAMKRASSIATETRTYTYESGIFPNWGKAKKLLSENGKILTWRK